MSVSRALRLSRVTRGAFLAACAVIVLAGVRAANSIIGPFLLAAFIAAVSLPALDWLRRHGTRTGFAVFAVVLLNAGLLTFAGWIVLESIVELRLQLPAYVDRARLLEQDVLRRLAANGLDLGAGYFATLAQPERLFDFATSAARNVTSWLTLGLLLLLYLVFMLAESVELPAKWRLVFGMNSRGTAGAERALRQVQRYLVLKTLISLATGLCIGLFMWLLELDFALFWGFLAFLLNFIPSIGSVIAAIPAIAIALLQYGPERALLVAAIYLGVNFTLGNVLDPIVVGRQLRLSPLVVLMSLVFWGFTLGLPGMFLAVPLTIAARILMQVSPALARYAMLLGPLPAPGEAVSGEWTGSFETKASTV
jgi:predicted PurR-regulated permease PerM